MTTQFVGVREFRQNLTQLYQKAQKKNLRYVVLNNNKPVFEVNPIIEKDVTLESLYARISHTRKQVARGKTHSLEAVEREFGL